MNDYNIDGTPYVHPFPWFSCAVVVATVITYPVLLVGLCAGWW